LEQHKQQKVDMRSRMWNMRSMLRTVTEDSGSELQSRFSGSTESQVGQTRH